MTRHHRDETGDLRYPARRRALVALGGAAIAWVARPARAARTDLASPDVHLAHGGIRAFDRYGPDSQHQALIDAAQRCVSAGEACLARGSRSEAVAHMVASCGDVARASRFDANMLTDAVARAAAFCADCESECRARGDAAFQICADACAAFVTESRKLTQAS
ncbi:hypothetical protein W911_02735 [Hyphomicrobium nitrativorans NL23]|uniref:Uncharacterized protein n=1 Tax=Hyphomicrobium nitrativorans NL23 TaxID=1029756 RepID=V5SH58_9HYPH|nr:hypothetical protein [Hyphomicrobium nitrativorans]AHB49863.1 hypothetical protein W911_02735 [Hyphomicrobium nitrativorans NL23]